MPARGTVGKNWLGKSDAMRIEVVQVGGFAGMRTKFTMNAEPNGSGDDAVGDGAKLAQLVADAEFWALPSHCPDSGQAGVRDCFSYRVQVEEGERTHAVHTTEGAAPASLRALIDWVCRHGKRGQ